MKDDKRDNLIRMMQWEWNRSHNIKSARHHWMTNGGRSINTTNVRDYVDKAIQREKCSSKESPSLGMYPRACKAKEARKNRKRRIDTVTRAGCGNTKQWPPVSILIDRTSTLYAGRYNNEISNSKQLTISMMTIVGVYSTVGLSRTTWTQRYLSKTITTWLVWIR